MYWLTIDVFVLICELTHFTKFLTEPKHSLLLARSPFPDWMTRGQIILLEVWNGVHRNLILRVATIWKRLGSIEMRISHPVQMPMVWCLMHFDAPPNWERHKRSWSRDQGHSVERHRRRSKSPLPRTGRDRERRPRSRSRERRSSREGRL